MIIIITKAALCCSAFVAPSLGGSVGVTGSLPLRLSAFALASGVHAGHRRCRGHCEQTDACAHPATAPWLPQLLPRASWGGAL